MHTRASGELPLKSIRPSRIDMKMLFITNSLRRLKMPENLKVDIRAQWMYTLMLYCAKRV